MWGSENEIRRVLEGREDLRMTGGPPGRHTSGGLDMSRRSRRLNRGDGDVCCVSAGLNTRPMFGCGRRLAYRSRMGYLNNWKKTEVGQIWALEEKK